MHDLSEDCLQSALQLSLKKMYNPSGKDTEDRQPINKQACCRQDVDTEGFICPAVACYSIRHVPASLGKPVRCNASLGI